MGKLTPKVPPFGSGSSPYSQSPHVGPNNKNLVFVNNSGHALGDKSGNATPQISSERYWAGFSLKSHERREFDQLLESKKRQQMQGLGNT